MSDPLSLLRDFVVNKRDIVDRDDHILFGEVTFPKTVQTNWLIWASGKKAAIPGYEKEYYTLECLLFLWQNVHLSHPVYVREAARMHIPVVRRPDRAGLLDYLGGRSNTSNSIDKNAFFRMRCQP